MVFLLLEKSSMESLDMSDVFKYQRIKVIYETNNDWV